MADNRVDLQCAEDVWLTPPRILVPVRKYFAGPIPLDPATQPNNPTDAYRFFTEETNGLIHPWDFPTFVNPPYGGKISSWIEKIHCESKRTEIIALLSCGSGRPCTEYYQDHLYVSQLKVICYLKQRVPFIRPDGTVGKQNNFPSKLCGFGVNVNRFLRCFGHLGKTLQIEIMNPDELWNKGRFST